MTFTKNVFQAAFNQEAQLRKQDSVHAAMNHWFVRNRGVQHKSWPVMYEPSYHLENLRCPAGIDETYWDTLSQAEKRWHESPVKNQHAEDRRSLWQVENALRARREIKQGSSDFYTQALQPVDPFEETFEGPSRAARKAHFRELASAGRMSVGEPGDTEQSNPFVHNNDEPDFDGCAGNDDLIVGIRTNRGNHVLPFGTNPKWKQAGNW